MNTTTIVRLSLLSLCASLATCDAEPPEPGTPREADVAEFGADEPADPEVARAPQGAKKAAPPRRSAVMPGAKTAFTKIAEIVDKEYVAGPLSEDERWTGAIHGMLDRLPQRGDHRINVLMSPPELAELVIGTKGGLVGVGIMIEHVVDVIVIKEVLPDGPAALAGLQPGDRILGIDGERVRELPLADVVHKIRGEEGTDVSLFVQRDTEEWTASMKRGHIHVDSVQTASLGDGIGYMRITSFAKDTATEIDTGLAALRKGGATRLVLDLRDCPGGLLDVTVGIAERFLPPGKTVLTIEPKDGKPELVVTKEDHRGEPLAVTVLIGPDTASSAEILADALRVHGEATLVGDTTFGKHTIETVHELEGGWAVKLSVSRFITASGVAGDGEGVRPDIRIPADDTRKMARVDALQPDEDPELATAMELLDRR